MARRSPRACRARSRTTRGWSRPIWGDAPPRRGAAVLALDRLEVHYGEIHALKGGSLAARDREIAPPLGNTGAGKTTTLKTISGLPAPRQGRVTFEGAPLTAVAPQPLV